MDTLLSMRIFRSVVELGGFARAADRLNLSPALVSKHVAHLEHHLGARLLNRTTRSQSLTEAGKTYFSCCQEMLNELDEVESLISTNTSCPRGVLRVSAPISFGVRHLGPLIAGYQARYPDVKLDVDLSDRIVDLVEDGYDVALRVSSQPHPTLIARSLCPARLLLVASPAYLDKHGRPQHPDELPTHRCITYAYNSTGNIWHFNGPDGHHAVSVVSVLQVNNGELACHAAVAGVGLADMPAFLLADEISMGKLELAMPDYQLESFTLYAVYSNRQYLSAKIRTFVDYMAEQLGPVPYWEKALQAVKTG
ncbi:LysR family transcriptional regulator [Chitinivorax sp. B]|uniref:LysR family transcriptional regulator n=1 Tax=Chitinivorax sp. B TaxID=2502235 RepID=UPI0010F62504|nr:LysR family transcriptional regulator [Chitinivorax sp. B]